MAIRTFQGKQPVIDPSAFVEESAQVIGDVVIGARSSIWFNSVVRGDVNYIRIGEESNVQDLCCLHVLHDTHPLVIGSRVTLGHQVTLHGCTVEDECLIGMGALVLDGAQIGTGSLVAAGSLVPPGLKVPPHSFVLGSPAKVQRPVRESERALIEGSAKNYLRYAAQYR